jgi:hypothetical protein
MIGSYSSSNFMLSAGAGGSGTVITDPPVVGGGVQNANIALFGNYIAGSFVTAAGQGGAVSSEAAPSVSEQPALTRPHA